MQFHEKLTWQPDVTNPWILLLAPTRARVIQTAAQIEWQTLAKRKNFRALW